VTEHRHVQRSREAEGLEEEKEQEETEARNQGSTKGKSGFHFPKCFPTGHFSRHCIWISASADEHVHALGWLLPIDERMLFDLLIW
jgi:hypothetical protein